MRHHFAGRDSGRPPVYLRQIITVREHLPPAPPAAWTGGQDTIVIAHASDHTSLRVDDRHAGEPPLEKNPRGLRNGGLAADRRNVARHDVGNRGHVSRPILLTHRCLAHPYETQSSVSHGALPGDVPIAERADPRKSSSIRGREHLNRLSNQSPSGSRSSQDPVTAANRGGVGGSESPRSYPVSNITCDSPSRFAGFSSAPLPGAVARDAGVVERRAWSWNA